MKVEEQDLAYMVNRLQVPLIINEILDGTQTLCDETHYALHETLSDVQPDTALITIALSMQALVKHSRSPFAMSLTFEAERLIQDYGSLWMSNAKNQAVSPHQIFDVLIHVAEDLDAVAELLELHESTLREQNHVVTQICQILFVQARAQALIAETFMDMVEHSCQGEAPLPQPESNVILFPVQNEQQSVHH